MSRELCNAVGIEPLGGRGGQVFATHRCGLPSRHGGDSHECGGYEGNACPFTWLVDYEHALFEESLRIENEKAADVPFGPIEPMPEPDIVDRLDHYANAGGLGVDFVPLREAATEIRNLRGAIAADSARLLAASDKVGMTPAGCDTADELADEILRLRALLDSDMGFKELGAKIVDGSLHVKVVPDDASRHNIKILAGMCWAMLLAYDGNLPANYMAADVIAPSLDITIATGEGGDPIRLAMTVVKPYGKSPHELRRAAEKLSGRLADALRKANPVSPILVEYEVASEGFAK